ncbi:hypothetical protein Lal_00035054 [Lupinus albus]|nr:hypothetical protein Lal_00035054 [Lupinus albus]
MKSVWSKPTSSWKSFFVGPPTSQKSVLRDDNENRTRGYPFEPNPNIMGKTRCEWVRVRVLPEFKFRVRVWY